MPRKSYKINTTDAAQAAAGDHGPLAALTPREQTIMLQSLLTVPGFPSGIQIDSKKVADRMGLQNPRSVSNAWSLIKKKILDYDKNDRLAKGLPEHDDTEEEEEDANPAPKKRARVTKAPAAAKAAEPAKPKTRILIKKRSVVPAPTASESAAKEETEDEAKQHDAGMAKLDGAIDKNGIESGESGESGDI